VTGRILLLSSVDLSVPIGGRAMLGRINLLLLRDLLGNRLVHLRPPHSRSRASDAWRGNVDGVDAALIETLLATIAKQSITQMFVDGSNFGAAIAAVKARAPHVHIITFFHNVEARFFWGSVRKRRSLKSLAVLAANYVAERKAVRYSDVLVMLSARDSTGLKRLYGRSADAIAPMVLEDKIGDGHLSLPMPAPACPKYLLFVGGGFYANIAGIRWFVHHVAPRIGLHVNVVGRGMDELAPEFAASGRATLVGAVDDLAPWYAGAALVIAPIFDGSGMKTKVAEALMHGKHIVGTPEAFSGYAADIVAANRCCADADGFVTGIADAFATPPPPFDPAMRALYVRDHSPAAARARLTNILGMDR
jgi:glycosyltransferase involved in cell wall biosynthesis